MNTKRAPDEAPHDHVLRIGQTPMPRTKLNRLQALGVEVVHLTPGEAWAALQDEEHRTAMAARLRAAEVCVLDEGTPPALATAVFMLREPENRTTLTTLATIAQSSTGVSLGRQLAGHREGGPDAWCCEHVVSVNLPHALSQVAADPVAIPSLGSRGDPITRPPLPRMYISDQDAWTEQELLWSEELDIDGAVFGPRSQVEPRELLGDGASARVRDSGIASVLSFLFMHLPTEELPLLTGRDMERWWTRLVDGLRAQTGRDNWAELAQLGEAAGGIEAMLYHALARDGGRVTLAGLPPALEAIRREAATTWDGWVGTVSRGMARHLIDATALRLSGTADRIIRQWSVVPWGDPFAVDADHRLFRPTLDTLRVARRYRPAGEVILEARRVWGGSPYREHATRNDLQLFVGESQPTSAADVEAWARVLQTLPPGHMREAIRRGMFGWERVDLPVINAWLPNEMGLNNVIAYRLPAFDRSGTLTADARGVLSDRVLSVLLVRQGVTVRSAMPKHQPARPLAPGGPGRVGYGDG